MKSPEEILQLIDIEKKLWMNDPDFYEATLTDDAILVFGETGVISRSFAVKAIREERQSGKVWEEVGIDDLRNHWVTDKVVMITYRVTAKWKDIDERVHCLASSLYTKKTGKWKLAFHQQTPIPADFTALETN